MAVQVAMFAGRPWHPFQVDKPAAIIPIRRMDPARELSDVLRGRGAQRTTTSRCWITIFVEDQHGERPKTSSLKKSWELHLRIWNETEDITTQVAITDSAEHGSASY
jgi:hypothetical protein